ncbi:MAG: hypothetical protein U0984_12005 [Prosthecobacter sp.]|nr:hypothetical protein [Prosthecobacter sp.]
MAGIGIVALRKRWKSVAIICGAVFLLTAASLFRDSRQRQSPQDALIVRCASFGTGIAGLALILLARRFKPNPDQSGMR